MGIYEQRYHKKTGGAAQKKYYENNRESEKARRREYAKKRRLTVLSHYSGLIPFCCCCGEKEVKFLALDHIKGGGNIHRKEIAGGEMGGNMYQWIIKNDFPEGFQILCHNCNAAKGYYGECPHKISII